MLKDDPETYLIGLDAGTTSVKGILTDAAGTVLAGAREEYVLETPAGDRCEVAPEVYWDKTVRVIRRLLKESGRSPRSIRAMAFSSQGETLLTLDREGNPLRKAIVWLDNRSHSEARELSDFFGPEEILARTGQPEVLPTWPATKILWMRRHEPSVFRKAHKFLMLADYLVYRLTGTFVTEHSLVSSTLYFDFRRKEWWGAMLDHLGIRPGQLPELLPPGTAAGNITPEAARETGLSPSTVVVTGAYDHPAGAIGAGNIQPGIVTETTGGAMAMCVTLSKPLTDPALRLPCQCHAVPGLYFLLPYGQTAGMVLQWFRDQFFPEETEKALREGRDPYEIMTAAAATVPAGAEGLTLLPHLMGAGSPEFDAQATGIFYGLSLKTTKAHFVRAILEGVVSMIKANVEILHRENIPVREIRVLGGGSRSDLWNQIKADMLGLPVLSLKNREAAALGAAILAGTGSGMYRNLQEAVEQLVKTDKIYQPDPAKKKIYGEVFHRYLRLYQQNKPLWQNRGENERS